MGQEAINSPELTSMVAPCPGITFLFLSPSGRQSYKVKLWIRTESHIAVLRKSERTGWGFCCSENSADSVMEPESAHRLLVTEAGVSSVIRGLPSSAPPAGSRQESLSSSAGGEAK